MTQLQLDELEPPTKLNYDYMGIKIPITLRELTSYGVAIGVFDIEVSPNSFVIDARKLLDERYTVRD